MRMVLETWRLSGMGRRAAHGESPLVVSAPGLREVRSRQNDSRNYSQQSGANGCNPLVTSSSMTVQVPGPQQPRYALLFTNSFSAETVRIYSSNMLKA